MAVSTGKRAAFTLLEVLIALVIMSTAMTVVVTVFVTTLRGWQRGSKLLDELHHGDFVMEQLVSALRSTALFPENSDRYGFWLEDDEWGGYPADAISFVTSGSAFIPIDSPLVNGLHRLFIRIEENEDGEAGVAVQAMPHLVDFEEWEEDETWFVSTVVKGLECRTYSLEEEDWDDDWEDTNSVPSLVEITLFMDPLEEGEEAVTISRVVEIPVAPVVAQAVRFREEDAEDEAAADRDLEEGAEAEASPETIEVGQPGPATGEGERP